LRRFAKDHKEVIRVEVLKLLAAEFIRECKNPIWLANSVLVPKKAGQWRMCIDYTDLNRHYPKDPFPLPRIDQVVDSTAGSALLCFLDCYSGYQQIALKVSDQDKTAFITPHGIYCYTAMTFGLKNAGATYQKAIQKCLESQISKNVEAYIDEMVVKTTNEDNLIADLAQTFANLWVYPWKLNPEKCVFGVPSGKLLGFMVSHRGNEVNPTKVDAIRKMNRPTGKKAIMKLTGMMAALVRFISKLGEKGMPFFKLLKKSDKFKWTDEADQMLEELKTFLTTPPVMVPPTPKETLLLYVSASTQVVSAVLVAERPEEGHQSLWARKTENRNRTEKNRRPNRIIPKPNNSVPVRFQVLGNRIYRGKFGFLPRFTEYLFWYRIWPMIRSKSINIQ
jgi:dsDNA-binding SOS-regulon protein